MADHDDSSAEPDASTAGAMTLYMTGVTIAYDREDSRGFVKKRATAVVMAAAIGFA